jgi:hypothetical protein
MAFPGSLSGNSTLNFFNHKSNYQSSMKKITELLAKITGIDNEIAELDKLESKASADLLLVASPGISVESARVKILDARLTIDLTAAKKNNAWPLRNKNADELKELLAHIVARWNANLEARREAKENEIVSANAEFFNGDERAARRWWEQGHFIQQPIFAKYRNAEYPTSALRRNPSWSEVQMAKHLMRHLQNYAEDVGINLEKLI